MKVKFVKNMTDEAARLLSGRGRRVEPEGVVKPASKRSKSVNLRCRRAGNGPDVDVQGA
jgi:hypothetical protein